MIYSELVSSSWLIQPQHSDYSTHQTFSYSRNRTIHSNILTKGDYSKFLNGHYIPTHRYTTNTQRQTDRGYNSRNMTIYQQPKILIRVYQVTNNESNYLKKGNFHYNFKKIFFFKLGFFFLQI